MLDKLLNERASEGWELVTYDSERVKWGQKRQMEQGVVFGRSMLGYDVEGGKMTINEEGAKVVRLIFHKFVNEGKGTHVIARELREEGISPMRVKEWSNTVILRVIRNEKYCGDLVQKKTYTPDFLSHEKKYNRGQEEFVIIKDHREPIISRELFDEANRILDAKSLSQEGKAKHSNRYPFSGKIKCGCCGSSYVARYKTRKDGSRYKAWRCNEAAKHGSPHIDKAGNQVGCTGLSIRNEDATHIMYLVTKSLKYNRDKIINNLTAVIQSIIAMDTTGTDTLAVCSASLKLLLALFCEVAPKGIVCGAVGGIEVFLPCVACNIRYSSLDIGQLRHLNKAVACHKSSPFCVVKVRPHFATDLSVAAVSAASADGTANENCGSNFLCIIAAVSADKL